MALTQPGHCPAVAYAKLQEVLAVCEADKLPEEELAEAKRELHVRKQARAQALEQERQDIDRIWQGATQPCRLKRNATEFSERRGAEQC